jgi:hypothetical protein
MKSVQAIIVTLLLSVVFTTNGYSQDKIGFTIQKVSMMGFEAKAMGAVTFNKSFTEMEIKQYVIPKDGIPQKNPEFKIQRYKLDGSRLDGKGIKEFENLDIVFCGAAISENEPNISITTFLDKDSCSLVISEYGYEVSGILIPNR